MNSAPGRPSAPGPLSADMAVFETRPIFGRKRRAHKASMKSTTCRTKTTTGRTAWYDRGDLRFDLCRALGMRIGVQICTEMWFFEWARHYAAARADLLCVPRATPHGSVRKWLAGGQAAAVCSGAYCLSSNIWNPPGGKTDCGGLAWVISPEGDVLAETTVEQPFATVGIDLGIRPGKQEDLSQVCA